MCRLLSELGPHFEAVWVGGGRHETTIFLGVGTVHPRSGGEDGGASDHPRAKAGIPGGWGVRVDRRVLSHTTAARRTRVLRPAGESVER